ncbi:Mediator of RNA polymerase II transcription subunit 13 [Fusarium oxysporum f. sp. albedinis]|nr:Mediator of RNA polymerase II transcription subunit 13 [Fusarium oxysporum f. sp. albedinis]
MNDIDSSGPCPLRTRPTPAPRSGAALVTWSVGLYSLPPRYIPLAYSRKKPIPLSYPICNRLDSLLILYRRTGHGSVTMLPILE